MAGVRTCLGVTFNAKTVVLTAGTFLNGLMHTGPVKLPGGRVSEPASYGLTEQLRELGFATDRMKTGTPVRIDGRSVDWSLTTLQEGDDDFHKFSYLSNVRRRLHQRPCHTVHTNPRHIGFCVRGFLILRSTTVRSKHRASLLSQHRDQDCHLCRQERTSAFPRTRRRSDQ